MIAGIRDHRTVVGAEFDAWVGYAPAIFPARSGQRFAQPQVRADPARDAQRLAELTPIKAVIGINSALGAFEGLEGWLFPVMAKALALTPFGKTIS